MDPKSVAEVAGQLVPTKVLYEDALQPAAREIGKTGETLGRAINAALAPLRLMVWSMERIEDYLYSSLAEKLREIPPEDIISPRPNVAVPAIESLRYNAGDPDLREMYSQLLANAMDRRNAKDAHPSFVEIIRQLTRDEARVINYLTQWKQNYPVVDLYIKVDNGSQRVVGKNFSDVTYKAACEHPDMVSQYVDNLCRLGLIEIPFGMHIANSVAYEAVESQREFVRTVNQIAAQGLQTHVERKFVALTSFGQQFCRACIGPAHPQA